MVASLGSPCAAEAIGVNDQTAVSRGAAVVLLSYWIVHL